MERTSEGAEPVGGTLAVTPTEYTDTGLEADTTYTYTMTALNDVGTGPASDPVTVTTAGPPADANLPVPSGLSAVLDGNGGVTLDWDDPEGDNADTITAYRILRGESADALETVVTDTGSTDTSYTDTSAEPGTSYHYAVRSRTTTTISGQSSTVTVATLAAPTGLGGYGSGLGVELTWDQTSDSTVTGYRILRGDAENSLETLVDDTASTASNYVDATAAPETTYWYALQARNAHGLGPSSGAVSVTAAPLPELNAVFIDSDEPLISSEQSASTTLISNLDFPATNASSTFFDLVIGNRRNEVPDATFTARFATGPHYYSVSSVKIDVKATNNAEAPVKLKAEIYSDNSGAPSSQLHTIGEIVGPTVGILTIEAAGNPITLRPNTIYHLVLHLDDAPLGSTVTLHTRTPGSATDSTTQPHWGEHVFGSARDSATDNWSSPLAVPKFAVLGEMLPTLISNLGQANATSRQGIGNFGEGPITDLAGAVRFDTGPQGSTVNGVLVQVDEVTNAASTKLKAAIHSDASGLPGTLVHSVGEITDLTVGVLTIDAATPFTLNANTTYWLVAELDDAASGQYIDLTNTDSSSPDPGGAPNWSIPDHKQRRNSTLPWITSTARIKFAVLGNPLPLADNTGFIHSADTPLALGYDSTGTPSYKSRATSFTTGTGAAAFNITALDFDTESVTGTVIVRVSIHESTGIGANAKPSDDPLHVSYMRLEDGSTSGRAWFRGYTPLAPSTTYWVVFEEVTGADTVEIVSLQSDGQAASSWAIGDNSLVRDFLATSSAWNTGSPSPASQAFKIVGDLIIAGDEIPPTAEHPPHPLARTALTSNRGQASAGETITPIIGNADTTNTDTQAAASFTTGNLPGGYTMTGIQVVVGSGGTLDLGDTGVVKATVREPTQDFLTDGKLIGSLGPTPATAADGVITVYAVTPIALEPETEYWIHWEMDHAPEGHVLRLDITNSTSEDSNYGAADPCGTWGFSIGDIGHNRLLSTDVWGSLSPPRITIFGGGAEPTEETASQPRCQDLAADTSTEGRITPGEGPAHGTLHDSGDADWFAMDLEASTDYEIHVATDRPERIASNQAHIIHIYDSTGTFVQTSEGVRPTDPGRETSAYVDSLMQLRTPFKPASAGTYYVDITAPKGGIAPWLVYTIRAITDDEPNEDEDTLVAIDTRQSAPWTATTRIGVKSGGLPTASTTDAVYATHSDRRPKKDTRPLESPDKDWIAVYLTASTAYTLTYKIGNTCTGGVSRYVAVIEGIYTDSTTRAVSGSSSICSTTLSYTPTATGWFYVPVTSGGSTFSGFTSSFDGGVEGTLTVTLTNP